MDAYRLYTLGLLVKKKEKFEKKLEALFDDIKDENNHRVRWVYETNKEMEKLAAELANTIHQIEMLNK
ncbi:hypothetical protein BBD42_01775 [Paenibacillus sp. BIHB 4019]|uniref:Uncharacterized protein n=1 Tax=Paenibacillus sp. BIHB 4019 TaxID=1870819 RepID=A0A1B2DCA2_9BACL|nr:hypothetical protein [Paenibacillus sp. BIHB 4019]ANY65344.1 hypothetical protein BBD42_01775 [Paenibacillus sp. BIHB 4019]